MWTWPVLLKTSTTPLYTPPLQTSIPHQPHSTSPPPSHLYTSLNLTSTPHLHPFADNHYTHPPPHPLNISKPHLYTSLHPSNTLLTPLHLYISLNLTSTHLYTPPTHFYPYLNTPPTLLPPALHDCHPPISS